MTPARRFFPVSRTTTTETAIHTTILADFYTALGERLEGDAWTVRLQIKPFMDWIWVGTLMMALGAGLSLLDRRFRLAPRREPRAALQPLQERSA